ncbi:hypothetical protein NRP93_000373 [Clostridium botulinum]|nr:hypothetical protein [Clostridium botulinum]
MLKLSILEFFLIGMPESFMFMMGIYFLTNKSFNKKKLIIMSLLSALEIYLVRMLPIHYGVHIFVNIIFSIIICVVVGKISIRQSISYNMIILIVLAISEFITMFIIGKIFKVNVLLYVPRVIWFIPSFALFTFNVFLIGKLVKESVI